MEFTLKTRYVFTRLLAILSLSACRGKIKPILIGLSIILVPLSVYAGEQQVNNAKDAGYTSCLATIIDLETFFTEGENYGSWSVRAKEKPNDQIFNASLGITIGSDGDQLIDLTIAPTTDGECSYSYTRTSYFSESCIALAKSDMMKNTTYKTELSDQITLKSIITSYTVLMPN